MIGGLLLLAGAALRVWSVWLNASFSLTIQTPERLELRGPYRLVRHPAYLGSLLMMLGLGILLAGLSATVVPVLVLHALLKHRADLEEALIVQAFPEYRTYQASVGQFIPKVRGIHGLW